MQSFNDRELQLKTMAEILNVSIKKTQKDIDYFFDEMFKTLEESQVLPMEYQYISRIEYHNNSIIFFEYRVASRILYYNYEVKRIFEPFKFKDEKINRIIVRYMNKYFRLSRISSVIFSPPF